MYKKLKETEGAAPMNAVGRGSIAGAGVDDSIAGTGVGPQGEPGVRVHPRKRNRLRKTLRKTPVLAGMMRRPLSLLNRMGK